MTRADAILAELKDRWAATAPVEACERMIRFIVVEPASQTAMLTYRDIGAVTGLDINSDALQLTITLLAVRFHALDTGYVFFADDGTPHYLNQEERTSFLESGDLGDPVTGEAVKDAAHRLYLYFTGRRDDLVAEVKD